MPTSTAILTDDGWVGMEGVLISETGSCSERKYTHSNHKLKAPSSYEFCDF